jgi:hypothetical protein
MFEQPETPEERIKKIDSWMETLKKDREATAAKLPGGGGGTQTISDRIAQEEKDAETFDKLAPGELVHLYQTDREQWQRLLDAKERQGLRKLMGR